jgi:hypothetical protein
MWYGLPFISYGVVLVVTVNSIGAAFQLVYLTLFIIYADTRKKVAAAPHFHPNTTNSVDLPLKVLSILKYVSRSNFIFFRIFFYFFRG